VANTAVLSQHKGQGSELTSLEKLCTCFACSTYTFPFVNDSSQNGHLKVKEFGYLKVK